MMPQPSIHSTQRNGMILRWHYTPAQVHFEMQAHTQGWLAVGFNRQQQLAGTNLIMGAVNAEQRLLIEDRYIVRFGQHEAKTALGAVSRLSAQSGSYAGGATTIRFVLPIRADDPYSHDLQAGSGCWLLLAFSAEPDFQHHSRMRTWAEVRL